MILWRFTYRTAAIAGMSVLGALYLADRVATAVLFVGFVLGIAAVMLIRGGLSPVPPVITHRWLFAVLAGSAVGVITVLGVHAAMAGSDPGVALYDDLHQRGATMPAAWARTVNANHALICHVFTTGYYDRLPATYRDEYGVTGPLAKAAITATGFCGVTDGR